MGGNQQAGKGKKQVESLEGVLERITFYNEENGFLIGKLKGQTKTAEIAVVGKAPKVQCGETLLLTGSWTTHPKHGRQFSFTSFESKLPASAYGIRKYLASGLIHGIGKTYANKIVDHFGADTLRIISEESGRLREIEGIGKLRAKSIKEAWEEQKTVREVMMFLQTYGVTDALCLRLVRKYGNSAKTILETEPYRIIREVKGIGFKTADKIALNLGLASNGPARIDAGILHTLQETEDEGHTHAERREISLKAAELLEADTKDVENRIDALMLEEELVISKPDWIQNPISARAEDTIVRCLDNQSKAPSSLPSIQVEKAIEWAQQKAGFIFADQQAEAVRQALQSKISILTGGPGTGKTTILRALVSILKAKKTKILLAAPTGRAARRMAESTSHFAQTVHRLLKFDPSQGGFTQNEQNPLICDFVIMDEASMLDLRLAAALIRSLPPKAHLLMVGDADQLPSVGSGNVLKDLIQCKLFQVTRLAVTFRQAENSGIVGLAHGILAGKGSPPPPLDSLTEIDPQHDVHFVRALTPEDCVSAVTRLSKEIIPKKFSIDPKNDLQILAPLHRGIGGIGNLNDQLRDTLNPTGATQVMGSLLFREGDKVIQTRNNYDKDVFNGDMGIIESVDTLNGKVDIDFEGKKVSYQRMEITDLQPAYAISVHKSQGSEYPVVIFPLLKQHFMMLQRNLVYTGLTRAKQKVIFVGDPAAYAMAIRNDKTLVRQTDLVRKLISKQ
ncbi:MAG: ATP-dependent RecD-like DNA helicase [Verrucomicrobiota bacterium]|nr:ATP-dependent RecD-like DNA helicase [Verrucomicrobiota bacterium]